MARGGELLTSVGHGTAIGVGFMAWCRPMMTWVWSVQDCQVDRDIKIPLITDMVDVLQMEAARSLRKRCSAVRLCVVRL